ncbi:Chromosome segregation protein SMC [Carpediemonas membranifera]|uniref:Chromosome segregation protein SMC n=1 Tax=Carpediemonas membranifera TaxID=201153 RepID=A0A8J6DYH6_9EUKA|nr:Chromosome segregation protein SMC [Carpediemonas membranifera]|eukprot:KAG9392259.1 Chromosome segregation protein SMC [Carpediemonas membranifera]
MSAEHNSPYSPLPAAMSIDERMEQIRQESYEAALETLRGAAEQQMRQKLLPRIRDQVIKEVQKEERKKLFAGLSPEEKQALLKDEIDRKVALLSAKLRDKHDQSVNDAVNAQLDTVREEMRKAAEEEIHRIAEERVRKERLLLRDETARVKAMAEKLRDEEHSQRASTLVRKRMAELETRASREQAQSNRLLNKLKSTNAAQEKELEELKTTHQKLNDKYARVVGRSSKLNHELQAKAKEAASAMEAKAEADRHSAELQAKVDSMTVELGEMREEHSHVMEGLLKTDQLRQEAETVVEGTREQLAIAQRRIAELEAELRAERSKREIPQAKLLESGQKRKAQTQTKAQERQGSASSEDSEAPRTAPERVHAHEPEAASPAACPQLPSLPDDVLDSLIDLDTPETHSSSHSGPRMSARSSPLSQDLLATEAPRPARAVDMMGGDSGTLAVRSRLGRSEMGRGDRASLGVSSRGFSRREASSPNDSATQGTTLESLTKSIRSHFEEESRAQHRYQTSAPLKMPSQSDSKKILFELERLFSLWAEAEVSFSHRCAVIETIRGQTSSESQARMIHRTIKEELAECRAVLEKHRDELELVKKREEVKSRLFSLKIGKGSKSDVNATMAELRRTDQKMKIGVEAARKLDGSPVMYRGVPYESILIVDGVLPLCTGR